MVIRLFASFAALIVSISIYGQNNYTEVSLPQLLQKLQEGKKDMIILDVRTRGEYSDTLSSGKHLNIGHIKGAVNIPLQDLQQKPEAIQQLDAYKDKDIYVICSHSYRSRTISNLLLQKGFTKVNNVQGGMSEWFRNFDQLQPYRSTFYEKNISYKNISPSELFSKIKSKENIEFIGFTNNPRFYFDSVIVTYYQNFPDFKNVTYFKLADSLKVLELARSANGKTLIFFNTIGSGAGETAEWLTQKGIPNVNYLYGNLNGFYEYILNYQTADAKKAIFSSKNEIQFVTPLSICRSAPGNNVIVDLRHDTLFNKITKGTKLSYMSIKRAVNFPYYKSADEFAVSFPEKSKLYVFSPHQGYVGIDLANDLLKKGYKVAWLIGGNERWEWYTNNVDIFKCRDWLMQ